MKPRRSDTGEQTAVLERARAGDPVALTTLYDQFSSKIYNYVYHRVGQPEIAEDLTGQVFMRMLECVRNGRAWDSSFSGWLYRIAHNLVIDFYRRRGRATMVDIDEAAPLPGDPDPFLAIADAMERERIKTAVRRLTGEQAEVITLRFLEDLSISEVAAIMNKTEGAIKALQYRAVLSLRRVMQA